MNQGTYDESEWQPTRWHVYLCNIKGEIQEELLDVEFTASDNLNQIPSATVNVTGKKYGYFRPWKHTIAITGDSLQEVVFFGPILNTRSQVAAEAEYAITTELDCQGWEAWLDRVYPMVEFYSEPGGPDAQTAWSAICAIWDSVEKRASKFQIKPDGAIERPKATLNADIFVTLDWDTTVEESRPGAPSAWSMHSELHAQGVDVNYRATWDDKGRRFHSRVVIGGSTNADTEVMTNPKTGRRLSREYVVGTDVADLAIETRGDMQATSVLATGVDSAYGVYPTYKGYSIENAAEVADTTFLPDVFAGLLLEYQYPADIQTANADDPEATCAKIAEAQRERLKQTPVLITNAVVRWKPGEIRPGDIVTITDNGGAQIADPYDNPDTPDSTVSTRWEVTGRVSGVSIDSSDMLHANLSIFELFDPNAELNAARMARNEAPLATPMELSTLSKASLSPVSFEQSMDNLTVDVERLLLQRGMTSGLGGTPAGSVIAYAGANIPDGWLAAIGQTVERLKYPMLWKALGTKYGAGNGETTFGLPDLRSRFIWGAGTTPLGEASGSYTIGANQLPKHTHPMGHTHTASVPQSAEHKHDLAASSWGTRYAVYPGTVNAPAGAPAPNNATWGSGLAPAGSANDRYGNGTHSGGAHDHGTNGKITTDGASTASTDQNDKTTPQAGFMPLYYALYYIIRAG